MPHARYDPGANPNPEVLDLETENARLKAMLDRWGRHLPTCQTPFGSRADGPSWSDEVCDCGWAMARDGTLWDFVGDSENIGKALASHEDDAVAERTATNEDPVSQAYPGAGAPVGPPVDGSPDRRSQRARAFFERFGGRTPAKRELSA